MCICAPHVTKPSGIEESFDVVHADYFKGSLVMFQPTSSFGVCWRNNQRKCSSDGLQILAQVDNMILQKITINDLLSNLETFYLYISACLHPFSYEFDSKPCFY